MRITNKHLIIIFGFGLVSFLTGLLFDNKELSEVTSYPMTIILLSGFYLLLKNGTYKNTLLYKITSLSVAGIFIGMMFKIMHWPGAAVIIIISVYSILMFYFFHFIKKAYKNYSDYGKLVILFLILTGRLLHLFHHDYGYEIHFLSNLIFIIFILYYLIMERRNGRLILDE